MRAAIARRIYLHLLDFVVVLEKEDVAASVPGFHAVEHMGGDGGGVGEFHVTSSFYSAYL